jgi:hypothetical protein
MDLTAGVRRAGRRRLRAGVAAVAGARAGLGSPPGAARPADRLRRRQAHHAVPDEPSPATRWKFTRQGRWRSPSSAGRRADLPREPTPASASPGTSSGRYSTSSARPTRGHPRFGGTGLGLSITKRFIEMHGGRIWSSEPGEARRSGSRSRSGWRWPHERRDRAVRGGQRYTARSCASCYADQLPVARAVDGEVAHSMVREAPGPHLMDVQLPRCPAGRDTRAAGAIRPRPMSPSS